jgi:hypothetical protein
MSATVLELLHKVGLTDLTDAEVRQYVGLCAEGKVAPNLLSSPIDPLKPLRAAVEQIFARWWAQPIQRNSLFERRSTARLRAAEAEQRAKLLVELMDELDAQRRARLEAERKAEMVTLQLDNMEAMLTQNVMAAQEAKLRAAVEAERRAAEAERRAAEAERRAADAELHAMMEAELRARLEAELRARLEAERRAKL